MRERQAAGDAERRLNEQLAEAQKAHEMRVAHAIAELEARIQAEREKSKKLQEQVGANAQHQAQLERERDELQKEDDLAREECRMATEQLARSKEEAEQKAKEVESMRQDVADLQAQQNATVAVERSLPSSVTGDFRELPVQAWSSLHDRFAIGDSSGEVELPEPTKDASASKDPSYIITSDSLAVDTSPAKAGFAMEKSEKH